MFTVTPDMELHELYGAERALQQALIEGPWMHAKGHLYMVKGVSVCSETKELRVEYWQVDDEGKWVFGTPMWNRPYSMWDERVAAPSGKTVPRFERVRPSHAGSKANIIAVMRRERLVGVPANV